MNDPERIKKHVDDLISNMSGKSDEELAQIEANIRIEKNRRLYEDSELYVEYRKFRPQMSTSPFWNALYEKIKNGATNKQLYAFLGVRGSGKSVMGACLIGHWCMNLGKRALYTSAVDMLNVFKMATHGFLSDYEHRIFKYLYANLLVIDCVENKFNDDKSLSIFDELIDKRTHASGPNTTILISNHTKQSFFEIVGKSAESRITAFGGVIGEEIFKDSKRNK